MGTIQRVAHWLGLRAESPASTSPSSMPAALDPSRVVWQLTDRRAMAVPAVFRAFQVLTTSATQLSLDVRRGTTPVDRVPSIIRRPSTEARLDEWLGALVLDLAVDGNAYARIVRGPNDEVLDLPLMPAQEVHISEDKGRTTYHYRGKKYAAGDVMHVWLLKRANWLKGISPLEAARRGLTFSAGASDYAGEWFNGGAAQPTGILSTDQTITRDQADLMRDVWNGLDAEGNRVDDKRNPSGIKVLGRGLEYAPTMLKPADVLWLEAQDWTLTDIGRLYGIPSSLMLIAVDSNTYQNVAQEWLAFTRFTLMAYLRPIEQALTELVARGLEVRFNLETLLRADTKTRYEAHEIALRNKWLTVDEVRAIEGLGPIPAALFATQENNV